MKNPEVQPGTFWETPSGDVREIRFRDDEFIWYVAHLAEGFSTSFASVGASRRVDSPDWGNCKQVADKDGTPYTSPDTTATVTRHTLRMTGADTGWTVPGFIGTWGKKSVPTHRRRRNRGILDALRRNTIRI